MFNLCFNYFFTTVYCWEAVILMHYVLNLDNNEWCVAKFVKPVFSALL